MQLSHHRAGRGEPLVLLHGIGCRWQYFEPQIPLLARDRDVIAIDLPGFGGSPPLPDGARPTAGALAAAVGAFLQSQSIDPATAHVAGNSLGGHVALELAARHGARSVCALSPVGFLDARERAWLETSLALTDRAVRALRPALGALCASPVGRTMLMGQLMTRPWRVPAAVLERNLAAFLAAPGWDATRSVIGEGRFERGPELAHIPVTIAWAAHDRLVLPGGARRALERIPAARLLWLRGCGHLPFWDDPGQVARAIRSSARSTS